MTKAELVESFKSLSKWADKLHDDAEKIADSPAAAAAFLDAAEKRTDLPATAAAGAVFAVLRGATPAGAAVQPRGQAGAASQGDGFTQTGFDDFLTLMAQSVVSTQKRLDQESEAYLAESSAYPHVPPTVFRMPKLEAEMKFDLQVEKGKSLNLLFWGATDRQRQTNQQGISFEIVSVPAPPGAMEAARNAVPVWRLVIDPLARRGLLAAVIQTASTTLNAPLIGGAKDSPDAVAFLDLGDNVRYLVLYAEDQNDKDVGIWLLTVPAGAAPALEAVYRFNKSLGPEEVTMRNLVLELAKRQQQLSGK